MISPPLHPILLLVKISGVDLVLAGSGLGIAELNTGGSSEVYGGKTVELLILYRIKLGNIIVLDAAILSR
jgi:hypothetical protein